MDTFCWVRILSGHATGYVYRLQVGVTLPERQKLTVIPAKNRMFADNHMPIGSLQTAVGRMSSSPLCLSPCLHESIHMEFWHPLCETSLRALYCMGGARYWCCSQGCCSAASADGRS